MQIFIALFLNSLALVLTAYIVPGFNINGFQTALLAAIVLGVVNTFIKPILSFVTAPINFLTLGLFSFIVNAAMLFLVASLVSGVEVNGWMAAILAAIVLSVVSTVLNAVFKDLSKVKLK